MTIRICHFFASLALVLLLHSCTSIGPRPADDLSSEQRAERAYAEGSYEQAARYWQLAGNSASGDNIGVLEVKAADAWLRSGQITHAEELLSQIDQYGLDIEVRALYYMAMAELALYRDDIGLAEFYLQAVNRYLPSNLVTRYGQLRARLEKIERDPFDRSLPEIAELAAGMDRYQPELALEIIRSLESVASGRLGELIVAQQQDPEFTEWLELALQIRATAIGGDFVEAAAQHWANYHYGHPVSQNNFHELMSSYRSLYPVPSRVAILLPDTGSLSAAARAVRDGVLSAYLEQPGDAEIRFYPSGENSETAIAAYQQARDDGAMHIIGPLRSESTRALSGLEDLSVPILLLNEPSDDSLEVPPSDAMVHSMTLSQSDEASAIANRALIHKQKHAIMMAPDDAWGARIANAFSSAFESGDGDITASAYFDINDKDHSDMLTRLLKIDESKQRKTDLQARLGIPLTFEPSRRYDFDLVFMAVNPAQGRTLKPLLRFHDAGEIPVYAVGRVFAGKVEPESDQDLNGIVFPSTRWQLFETVAGAEDKSLALESLRGGAFGNLYALGQDAWRLLPWLPLMRKDPDLWYPGKIGSLRLQSNGQLYRDPVWAQIADGRPVPYQWPAINDNRAIK